MEQTSNHTNTGGASGGCDSTSRFTASTTLVKENVHACERNTVGRPTQPAVSGSDRSRSHHDCVPGGASACSRPLASCVYECEYQPLSRSVAVTALR